MKRRTFRIWHHWLSVIGGVFLLTYSVTGLWHVPREYIPWWGASPERRALPPVDLSQVVLSPEEGVAAAMGNDPSDEVEVRSLILTSIGGRPFYDIRSSAGRHIIDAQTGAPLEVDADMAERIVRSRFVTDGMTLEREFVEAHRFGSGAGEPAYYFRPSEDPATVYVVSEANGAIAATNRSDRINVYIRALHAMRPARDLTGSTRAQILTMLVTTVFCILLAGTGVFLILPLPKRRRARTAARSEPDADP